MNIESITNFKFIIIFIYIIKKFNLIIILVIY